VAKGLEEPDQVAAHERHVRGLGGDAEHAAHLAGRDLDADAGQEADQHRP
jgi:hypothetical protein